MQLELIRLAAISRQPHSLGSSIFRLLEFWHKHVRQHQSVMYACPS